MRAVITVIGKDMVGILARVSNICFKNNANIVEVTQSVLQDMFAMIMLVDISSASISCAALSDEMNILAKELSLSIHVMHEDVFNTMHHI
jgi:ACT domain-containing protein